MTATLLPNAKQQFLDTNGRPLAGGQVYFYIPNTSTLKSTWQDAGKTVLNTNPVVLDANGQAIIYGEGQYRQVVYDVHGNLIWDKLTDSYALNSEFQSFVTSIESATGSSLIGFIQPDVGAIAETVQDKLREEVSLLDFMTNAQRAAVYSGDAVDQTSAFTKAEAYLAAGNRTVTMPAGTFNFSDTFDVPAGSCVKIDPKAVMNFTSTVSPVIRIRRGVLFHGNLAKLNMTNAAWDGDAILLDGSDQFLDTYPTFVSGLTVNSATFPKGTMVHLQALNANEYISFVHLRDFSAGDNMKYALVVSCGSSGSAGTPSTWHWINSNVLENFTSSAKFLMSVVGLPGTPAEVAANQFLNFHHQTGASSGLPIYFYGASNNTFTGWIWDWNNASGSPIVFDGGALWNNVKSNVDTSVVTTAQQNKVEDFTGGETGQRYIYGLLQTIGRTYFGKFNTVGQWAATWFPDPGGVGSFFHAINRGNTLSFATGPDAYTAPNLLNLRDDGSVVVGDSNTNPTVSTLRTNGAINHAARATKVGVDGYAADLFENSAGAEVGSVVITTSATTYNTSSDYRLKNNVANLTGSGAFIDALRPVSWSWKVDGSHGAGFIAHELQVVSPTSVTGEKDKVDPETGEPIYQAVEYGSAEVVANLVAEVQALRKRLAAANL